MIMGRRNRISQITNVTCLKVIQHYFMKIHKLCLDKENIGIEIKQSINDKLQ